MRELKFRAWDKITNKYYVVNTLEYADNGELCEVWLADILVTEPNDACRNHKDVVLEQYAGLRDKNGEEIYEGDIIAYDYGFGTYVVTYRRYDASFVLEDDKREEVLKLALAGHPFYEVIGNIHENPELLEEQ